MNKLWYWILSLFGIYPDAVILGGLARASDWSQFVKDYAKIHPRVCPFCGKKKVQLHHKYETFAQNPAREKDSSNLMWACQGFGTNNCHLRYCHLGDFQSLNDQIDEWLIKIQTRPRWNGEEWIKKQPNKGRNTTS